LAIRIVLDSKRVVGVCLWSQSSSAFGKCISLNAKSCLFLPTASLQLNAEGNYDLPFDTLVSYFVTTNQSGDPRVNEPKPPLAMCLTQPRARPRHLHAT
jgi:hypothetical protein